MTLTIVRKKSTLRDDEYFSRYDERDNTQNAHDIERVCDPEFLQEGWDPVLQEREREHRVARGTHRRLENLIKTGRDWMFGLRAKMSESDRVVVVPWPQKISKK